MVSDAFKREQDRILGEHRENVKLHSQHMKTSINNNDVKEVLRHASLMIGELRTGLLTPNVYYELYMDVFDHLNVLHTYFTQLVRSGLAAKDLYEAVQNAGNVLPRLYMMITAGAVYIKSGQSTSLAVLQDLIEYIKGVQHAQRGLFVRYYLIQRMKNLLPDSDSMVVSKEDARRETIDFLCTNLVEMNRLWARMQTLAGSAVRNKKRRERERQELRVCVGLNLTILSNIDGLTLETYKSQLLPRVLTEISACRDKIAQAYLFESLLQVFPLEFLLPTLDQLLSVVPKLVPSHATYKTVILSLLSRIQEAALVSGGASTGQTVSNSKTESKIGVEMPTFVVGNLPLDIDIFGILLSFVEKMSLDPTGPFMPSLPGANTSMDQSEDNAAPNGGAASHPSGEPSSTLNVSSGVGGGADEEEPGQTPPSIASLLDIYGSMLSFTLTLFPGHTKYVDAILSRLSAFLRLILGLPAPQDVASFRAQGPLLFARRISDFSGARAQLSQLTSSLSLDVLAASLHKPGEAAKDEEALFKDSFLFPETGYSSAQAGVPSEATIKLYSSFTTPPPAVPSSPFVLDEICSLLVVSLLEKITATLGGAVTSLQNFHSVLGCLDITSRKEVSSQLLNLVVGGTSRISDPVSTRLLLAALSVTIHSPSGSSSSSLSQDIERDRVLAEQNALARLVSHLGPIDLTQPREEPPSAKELEDQLLCLVAARDFLSFGGSSRIPFTLPAVAHACARLAVLAERASRTDISGDCLQLSSEIADALLRAGASDASLALFTRLSAHLAAESVESAKSAAPRKGRAAALLRWSLRRSVFLAESAENEERRAGSLQALAASLTHAVGNANLLSALDSSFCEELFALLDRAAAASLIPSAQTRLLITLSLAARSFARTSAAAQEPRAWHDKAAVYLRLSVASASSCLSVDEGSVLLLDVLNAMVRVLEEKPITNSDHSISIKDLNALVEILALTKAHRAVLAAKAPSSRDEALATSGRKTVRIAVGEAPVDFDVYYKNTMDELSAKKGKVQGFEGLVV